MRLGAPWVIRGPINRVHDASLRGGWRGGQCKVRVATQVSQQGDFVVQAAPAAVGPRVIKRPVAVDEPESDFAVVLPQQAVAMVKGLSESTDAVYKVLLAFPVVMDVHLDVGDAGFDQFGERIQNVRAVLLLGVKERVPWWPACRVAVAGGNFGPLPSPQFHPTAGGFLVGTAPERLEMVGKGDPDPGGRPGGSLAPQPLAITWQPEVCVSRKP